MVGSVRSSVIEAPPPNVNVMESSCGGWTRGSAGGGFLFNPRGVVLRGCLDWRTRMLLQTSPPQDLAPRRPGHGNAPRLTNMPKAAGHRVKYQSYRKAPAEGGAVRLIRPLELARGNQAENDGPNRQNPVRVRHPLVVNEVAAQSLAQSRRGEP